MPVIRVHSLHAAIVATADHPYFIQSVGWQWNTRVAAIGPGWPASDFERLCATCGDRTLLVIEPQ